MLTSVLSKIDIDLTMLNLHFLVVKSDKSNENINLIQGCQMWVSTSLHIYRQQLALILKKQKTKVQANLRPSLQLKLNAK